MPWSPLCKDDPPGHGHRRDPGQWLGWEHVGRPDGLPLEPCWRGRQEPVLEWLAGEWVGKGEAGLSPERDGP